MIMGWLTPYLGYIVLFGMLVVSMVLAWLLVVLVVLLVRAAKRLLVPRGVQQEPSGVLPARFVASAKRRARTQDNRCGVPMASESSLMPYGCDSEGEIRMDTAMLE